MKESLEHWYEEYGRTISALIMTLLVVFVVIFAFMEDRNQRKKNYQIFMDTCLKVGKTEDECKFEFLKIHRLY